MRFAFTDEQRLFGDSVRALLDKECSPDVVRARWDGDSSSRLWAGLVGLGVVGLTVPEARGGLGLGEVELVLPLEETGRAVAPVPIVETTAVGAPLLRDLPDPSSEQWLSAVAAGDAILTVGHERSPFVSDADVSDLLLLQHGDEVHAVERDRVALVPEPSVDRARRLFTVEWDPEPSTALADGDAGREAWAVAFDRGALAVAAQLVGIAQHMLDVTVDYACERQQFGQPIGGFQAVKHQLADVALRIEFTRPAVYRAAWSVAHGVAERSRDVSMAKAYASDTASLAARTALQVHGAIGYTVEYDLHMWMKRAWALAAVWGDAEWHRSRVADAVIGPD